MTPAHYFRLLVVFSFGLFLALVTGASAQEKKDPLTEEFIKEFADGKVLMDRGEKAAAIPHWEKAITIAKKLWGPEHFKTALLQNLLANLYQGEGQLDKAESLFRSSLKVLEKTYGAEDNQITSCLNGLGEIYRQQGKYNKAEPLLLRCLKIHRKKLGDKHADVARSLNDLGLLYQRQGQLDKAEPCFVRSLKTYEDALGRDDLVVAIGLNNLAMIYLDQKKLAEAAPLFRRSLKIREAKLDPNHPDIAQSLDNLGGLYNEQGETAQAEALFERSLKLREARLGPNHPDVAYSLNNLSTLYFARGEFARAAPLMERSVRNFAAGLGDAHPVVIACLNNLGTVYAAQADWTRAIDAFDRARRGQNRHIKEVLPALRASEQLAYLRTQDLHIFHAALSLGQQQPEAAAVASYAWLLNGKAMTEQALAVPLLQARSSANPELAGAYKDLIAVRRELASLALVTPKAGQGADLHKQLDALVEREQNLAKRLGQEVGPGADWIDVETVRRALPERAVLIDVARFVVRDFKGKSWRPAHYVAWVVPPAGKGTIRVVDLGEADRIDAAVRGFQKAINQAPKALRTLGEPDAEKELRPALSLLGKLVVEPLSAAVDKAERWIISPDASLWLVPWAALPLPDGSYAVEKHEIRCVVSGRDLVSDRAKIAPNRPVILADPNYDLEAKKARTALRGLFDDLPAPGKAVKVPESSRLPVVQRLPGTAAEANQIQAALEKYAQAEPRVYQDNQAQEYVFKTVRNPRVLVLSTHGYFLADQAVEPVEVVGGLQTRSVRTKDGEKLENPLLRCGLLLAGCNQRGGTRRTTDDDGVLTGLEIVGTDLRGCELVVLSACETGLGEVQNGEGVAGLRQAFQLAGADAVVATLWQIPDRQSAQLMIRFFDELATGKDKATALAEAQRAMIKQRREKNASAHPLFWAAFTLTGK